MISVFVPGRGAGWSLVRVGSIRCVEKRPDQNSVAPISYVTSGSNKPEYPVSASEKDVLQAIYTFVLFCVLPRRGILVRWIPK